MHPNAVLYADVTLGDRVEVHSGTVLGGDGFGYRHVDGRHVKIPHTGRLEVESDVEIGSNCTIDRATFETSRIGEGTKIDNLVMIGHNNKIGSHNLLCGQVGIAGSCKTGDHVVIAGQAGIKDNTQIGDRVVIGAQAGVHRNIPDGQNVLGSPAIPVRGSGSCSTDRRLPKCIASFESFKRSLLAARCFSASGEDRCPTASVGARCVSSIEEKRLSRRLRQRLAARVDSVGSRAARSRPSRPLGGERSVSNPVCRSCPATRPSRGLRRNQI